jgi:predicted alpha/beta hydrolase family esterase
MLELETMRALARVYGQIDGAHPVSPPPNDTNGDPARQFARYPRIPPKPSPKLAFLVAYYNTQRVTAL